MGGELRRYVLHSDVASSGFLNGMCEVLENGKSELMRKPTIQSTKGSATNLFVVNVQVPAEYKNNFLPIEIIQKRSRF
jgi:hypothetical protein